MKKRQSRMPIRRAPEIDVLDTIERWGNDIETAVKLALEELKAEAEDVDVEVLEEPSRGFFGIGAKLAKVRVTRKAPEAAPEEVVEKPKKQERGPIRKEELTEEEKNSYSNIAKEKKEGKDSGRRERSGKGRRGHSEPKKSIEERLPEEPIIPKVNAEELTPLAEHEGLTFLQNLSKEMGLDINIEGKTDGKDVFFFIDGKDSGTIIGKRGATLDAIQYLTSLVVNKDGSDYTRVVVDAENYRAKREKSLEKLAIRLADKVARSKRSYKLEPMNPYERKVIHATLQSDSRIVTRSEGQDPSRRVIIEPK